MEVIAPHPALVIMKNLMGMADARMDLGVLVIKVSFIYYTWMVNKCER